MARLSEPRTAPARVQGYARPLALAVLGTIALWTFALAMSLFWNLDNAKRQMLDMAYAEAGAVRDKDMAFRRWAMRHGGVYVAATVETAPSPYLSHVPRRDLHTVDGQNLTLRAPATMVREMMDDYAEHRGVRGRITGLRYLNPANAPDAWERRQLEAFTRGEKSEVWEIADMDGKPYLRYLRAWYMEPVCVECHAVLGYKVGDMRGATGVNLPLAPYYERLATARADLIATHGTIWLLGLVGIGWAGRETWQRRREQVRAEKDLRRLAHHDSLTGLFNRHSLEDRLGQALATAQREDAPLAVMFIDLDHFKRINDSLGHSVGDALLIEVARRLRTLTRESDIVARLGGDEFVVVLTGIDAVSGAMAVAAKILHTLEQPYAIGGNALHSTASIGVTTFPDDGATIEALMRNADTAMYHAKDGGRNAIQFFAASMNEAAAERLALEGDLREALAAGELELHYQPQVDAVSRRLCGFEALLRWRHPRRGMVSPLKFVPIAEESGLIEPIGAWVIDTACRQLAAWRAAGRNDFRLAVNLSARQLRSSTLVAEVRDALARHALDPDVLELEVTESVAMSDPDRAIGQLHALRAVGVTLAIDDFGTGYSSLAYLKMLPIQILKIDRAFVSDIETDANDAAICTATVALAKSLGLKVVAEGVETGAQRDFLVAQGCDLLQGYLFGRPQPADSCFPAAGEAG